MFGKQIVEIKVLSAGCSWPLHRGKSDHFRRILQLLHADTFSGEGKPSIPEPEPYVVRTEKRQRSITTGKPI